MCLVELNIDQKQIDSKIIFNLFTQMSYWNDYRGIKPALIRIKSE